MNTGTTDPAFDWKRRVSHQLKEREDMKTYLEILTDADHEPIDAETLDKIRVPDGFEDAYHIYLAEEAESPVVAEYVDTTTEYGKQMFRITIAELIEKVKQKPDHYFTALIDSDEDEVPEDCNAVPRAEVEEWVENVLNSEVTVHYLMHHG